MRECDQEYEPGAVVITIYDSMQFEQAGFRPGGMDIAQAVDAVDLAIEKAREQSRLL